MFRFFKKRWSLLALLLILAIAAFFRLWQLNEIPPGLYPDVAMNGNDALETLRTNDFKVFYPDNNGREGLMMWLIALSFSVFGVSVFSIKIVAAIIGILTVFGTYLLTKELFAIGNWKLEIGNLKNEAVALLASFFLATSFWHTLFSRIGFRAILLPFVLVFSFYLLLKGFNSQKNGRSVICYLLLAGVFFGLGFYTYISYRMILLLLPLVFLCLLFYKNNKKQFLLSILYFLIPAIIIALPLGFYFLQNSQDFVGRAAPISVFAAENPLKELAKSLVLHLGMFNFSGDQNWRHNFAGSPMLPLPIGILFLLGFGLLIKQLIISIKTKNHSLLMAPALLFPLFFTMLLPGILTYEGVPHALRVIGVIPIVYIFVALGAWKIYEFLSKNTARKKLLLFAAFLFLFAIATLEFNKYFIKWARNPNVQGAFTKTYADIGYFLNSLPNETQKYVIVNEPDQPLYGISIPAQTLTFIESTEFGKPRTTYLKFENLDQIKIKKGETVIIPLYDGRTFNELQKRFPGGEISEKNGFDFYLINQTP